MQPGDRLGPYEIVAFIGAGGMGEVYRARDERLEREVALKVLPAETLSDPTARARLLREARLASQLNHPNVCTVHEVGETDGRAYIAMELVEGQPLASLIAKGGLPPEQVLTIGQQLADALSHAHARGVVHRDLKAANVLVTPEGRVKVLDFGLAKRLASEDLARATTLTQASLTEAGMVVGTLAYMAPEQLRGEGADARSDVWALGVVLHEMAAGARPFRGATGYELTSAILKEEPEPLPASVPVSLAAVIERCLAKEPAQRYQRGGEVEAALEAVASGETLPAWPALRAWVARHRVQTVMACASALLVMLIGLDVGGVRSRLLGGPGGGQAIRMAVLPFANLSGDPEQEYLSDGLTQEMIAQLGRLHPASLSVIARTSVMRYKKAETPIDQIGRELNVDYVLEGSAQKEGGRVRVSAELIKVKDQSQLWADTFEREMSSILALQSDVARRVADALALKLLPAEKTRLASARQIDPEAYDAYLKGSQHWIRMTKEDLDTAEGYFNLALKKDLDFAPAHVGMAWVWAVRNQMGYAPPSEAVPKEREAALKAVALDDTLAEAHYVLATVRTFHDWDLAAAAPEWRRASELDPNNPNGVAMYSHYLAITGHVDEAMTEIERAVSLDPFNVTVHAFRANDLLFARRYDEAIAEARKALAMEPGQPAALLAEGLALMGTGRYERALPVIKDYYKQIYGLSDLDAAIAKGFSEGGFEGAMRRGAGALSVLAAKGEALPSDVAILYWWAGDSGRALAWLEKAYQVRDPGLPYWSAFPFDSLRSEPRFQALLRKMGLPQT
jgi:TolB-like protein/tRNA A-37 threonylcarbamoyl transferase component Bud32